MRAAKAVFLIGIIFLVLSAVITAIGASGETWQRKEQPLVEKILAVPGGFSLFPLQNLIFMPDVSRDIVVTGTVKELSGRTFDFYAFNKRNYELWVAKAPYKAFIEAKGIPSNTVNFSPTREDVMNALYFVVVNKNPFSGPQISVEFSIKISWSERSYAQALGGFVLGTLLGGIGLLLVVLSAIMKFVFGRSAGKGAEPSAATQAAMRRFCTNCGAAFPADVKFCKACGSPTT